MNIKFAKRNDLQVGDMLPGASAKSTDYQLDQNEIIIPKAFIQNSDEDHISAWGHMEGWNTSFEIPNGSIGHWKELWEKQGVDGLEVTFYDKGYTYWRTASEG